LGRGADALILDLEDAVALTAKSAARELVGQWLSEQGAPAAKLWVRVNGGSLGRDIGAVMSANLAGIVVPKAEPRTLAEADAILTAQERRSRFPQGSVRVLALIETARGLIGAAEVAAAPRVAHLGIGEADLAAELRLTLTDTREEMMPLRLQIVVASAAAGIGAPVAPACTDFHDLEALRRSTRSLLKLGFRARTAIHPAQLAVINEVFTPTAEELLEARQLVLSFRQAEEAGTGVITDGRGRMVDIAAVRAARETLGRASSRARDGG
jgi:citrate lyase subunit beta/citryl-CoA lyase